MPIRRALLPHVKWNQNCSVFFLSGFYLENFQMIENHLKMFLEPFSLSYKKYLLNINISRPFTQRFWLTESATEPRWSWCCGIHCKNDGPRTYMYHPRLPHHGFPIRDGPKQAIGPWLRKYILFSFFFPLGPGEVLYVQYNLKAIESQMALTDLRGSCSTSF